MNPALNAVIAGTGQAPDGTRLTPTQLYPYQASTGVGPAYPGSGTAFPTGYPTAQASQQAAGTYVAPAPVNYSGAINSTFAAPQANWDAIYGDLNRNRDFNSGQIDNTFATNRSGIDLSNRQGSENLDRSETGVGYAKSNSLRDLSKNIGSAVNSRLNMIGSKGAGSSSAGYGAAMALHNVENDQRAGIFDDAGQQYGDIALQRGHLKEQYGQATQQLDDWKAGEIAKIANDYLNEKGRIDRDKAGGDQSQQSALAANSLAAAQSAAASLAQVQAAHSAAIRSLGANTAAGTAVGDKYSPILSGVNYHVQAIDGSNPAIQYSGPTSPQAMGQFSPYAPRKTDQTF